jgi:cation diffusion facilitator family transporter
MLGRVYPLIVALIAGFLILLLKLAAYYISNSMALKSDALESLVNLLAGSFATFSVLYARKPADTDHPYGHGKIEYVSSFFEGGLILLAAILISYEAVENLIRGMELKELGLGLLVNFAAGVTNGILGLWLIRAGKKKRSAAIEADGHHLLTDFITTSGIAAGLLAVHFTGISWLDPAIALVFGIWLGFTGGRVLFRAILSLMDTEDPEGLKHLLAAMNSVDDPDVLAVHALRTRHSGDYVHVDVHLVLPEIYDIGRANEIVHAFEQRVLAKANLRGEFHSHADPCKGEYCFCCHVEPCPIRKEPRTGKRPDFLLETATAWPHGHMRRMLDVI